MVGSSLKQITAMLDDLETEAKNVGLKIHMGKTKILNNCIGLGQRISQVSLNGRDVAVLNREEGTMCLGRLLNLCDTHQVEFKHRISQAWKKYEVYWNELVDKKLLLYQRFRLLHTVVTPSILYGSGSWAMTKSMEMELQTTQRKMLRSILGKGRSKDEHSILEPWVDWKKKTTQSGWRNDAGENGAGLGMWLDKKTEDGPRRS